MQETNRKLNVLAQKIRNGERVKIAILGLGSVGNYLLEYLNNWSFDNVEIIAGVRNVDKARSDVNIARVARLIRGYEPKPIRVKAVDLDDVNSIEAFLTEVKPDFVVNSSRAYSGLKYGTISWHTIRAYGLWAPLAIKYIRNIMDAHRRIDSAAIVINTSYSDAVIPWLKSAGRSYPDFGSGNLNHLIPRIKMAVAAQTGIDRCQDIEVILATAHFHDVVISKEGQTEGVEPLLKVLHKGRELSGLDVGEIWKSCAIAMPVDAKRNMMNASSNFEIIRKIVEAILNRSVEVIHSPGVGGNIGGYPVKVDGTTDVISMTFNEDYFSFDDMSAVNRKSLALDGVEDVRDGALYWTDCLAQKVKKNFDVAIPKSVQYEEISEVANFIVSRIVEPYLAAHKK